jgi:hypothetical protein
MRPSGIDRKKQLFEITGKCEPPTDVCLQAAISIDFFAVRSSGITEMPYEFAHQALFRASIAHWIIKLELNPRHKHPCRKLAEASKPLADVYHAVFKACEKLHTWNGGGEYPHASARFSFILWEFNLGKVCSFSVGNGKDAAIAALRKINSSLATLKNGLNPKIPLHKIFHPQYHEHTYKIFWQLIQPVENTHIDALRNRLLTEIINSLKSYVSYLVKSETNIVNIGESKDFVISGRDKKREYRPNLFFDFQNLSQ